MKTTVILVGAVGLAAAAASGLRSGRSPVLGACARIRARIRTIPSTTAIGASRADASDS